MFHSKDFGFQLVVNWYLRYILTLNDQAHVKYILKCSHSECVCKMWAMLLSNRRSPTMHIGGISEIVCLRKIEKE